MNNVSLQQFNDLHGKFEELEKLFKNHRHNGVDNAKILSDDISDDSTTNDDPDVIHYPDLDLNANVSASYTDDLDNIPKVDNDTYANLYVWLYRRDSFCTKYLSGNEQKIKPSTIWAGGTDLQGLLVYNDYYYIMIKDGTPNYRIYRAPLVTDISDSANWTQMTISGTAISGTSYLVGAYNGALYIANGSAYISYNLNNTTLTSGASITVAGSSYTLESRVNNNGIYATFAASPYVRKATIGGTLVTGKEFSGTSPTIFRCLCTANSFYIPLKTISSVNIGLTKID